MRPAIREAGLEPCRIDVDNEGGRGICTPSNMTTVASEPSPSNRDFANSGRNEKLERLPAPSEMFGCVGLECADERLELLRGDRRTSRRRVTASADVRDLVVEASQDA